MLKIFLKSPIYYHYPLYNQLHKKGHTDFKVYYWSKAGIEPYHDVEMPGVLRTWCTLDDLEHPHAFLKSYRFSRFDSGFFPRCSFQLYREILSSTKRDVIFLQGYANFDEIISLLLSKLVKSTIVFRGEGIPNLEESWLKEKFKSFLLSHVGVACYSTSQNKRYIEKYIQKACELKHYPSVSNLSSAQAIYSKKTRVILASRLTDRKNIDTCLKVFSVLFPECYSLHIYGDGSEDYKNYLKKLIFELNLNTRVIFHGFVEQSIVLDALRGSEWFMNLAKDDPSPKAVNEALALKCKIILSTGVGTHEDLKELQHVLILSNDKINKDIKENKSQFDQVMCMDFKEIEFHADFKLDKCIEALEYVSKNNRVS